MCLGIRPLEKGILKTNVGIMLAGWCFCVLPQLWTSPDASNNQQNHNCVCVKVLVLNRTMASGVVEELTRLFTTSSKSIHTKTETEPETEDKTKNESILHAPRTQILGELVGATNLVAARPSFNQKMT